jgi:hypothetical protein
MRASPKSRCVHIGRDDYGRDNRAELSSVSVDNRGRPSRLGLIFKEQWHNAHGIRCEPRNKWAGGNEAPIGKSFSSRRTCNQFTRRSASRLSRNRNQKSWIASWLAVAGIIVLCCFFLFPLHSLVLVWISRHAWFLNLKRLKWFEIR